VLYCKVHRIRNWRVKCGSSEEGKLICKLLERAAATPHAEHAIGLLKVALCVAAKTGDGELFNYTVAQVRDYPSYGMAARLEHSLLSAWDLSTNIVEAAFRAFKALYAFDLLDNEYMVGRKATLKQVITAALTYISECNYASTQKVLRSMSTVKSLPPALAPGHWQSLVNLYVGTARDLFVDEMMSALRTFRTNPSPIDLRLAVTDGVTVCMKTNHIRLPCPCKCLLLADLHATHYGRIYTKTPAHRLPEGVGAGDLPSLGTVHRGDGPVGSTWSVSSHSSSSSPASSDQSSSSSGSSSSGYSSSSSSSYSSSSSPSSSRPPSPAASSHSSGSSAFVLRRMPMRPRSRSPVYVVFVNGAQTVGSADYVEEMQQEAWVRCRTVTKIARWDPDVEIPEPYDGKVAYVAGHDPWAGEAGEAGEAGDGDGGDSDGGDGDGGGDSGAEGADEMEAGKRRLFSGSSGRRPIKRRRVNGGLLERYAFVSAERSPCKVSALRATAKVFLNEERNAHSMAVPAADDPAPAPPSRAPLPAVNPGVLKSAFHAGEVAAAFERAKAAAPRGFPSLVEGYLTGTVRRRGDRVAPDRRFRRRATLVEELDRATTVEWPKGASYIELTRGGPGGDGGSDEDESEARGQPFVLLTRERLRRDFLLAAAAVPGADRRPTLRDFVEAGGSRLPPRARFSQPAFDSTIRRAIERAGGAPAGAAAGGEEEEVDEEHRHPPARSGGADSAGDGPIGEDRAGDPDSDLSAWDDADELAAGDVTEAEDGDEGEDLGWLSGNRGSREDSGDDFEGRPTRDAAKEADALIAKLESIKNGLYSAPPGSPVHSKMTRSLQKATRELTRLFADQMPYASSPVAQKRNKRGRSSRDDRSAKRRRLQLLSSAARPRTLLRQRK
jgi:hypothetical protein